MCPGAEQRWVQRCLSPFLSVSVSQHFYSESNCFYSQENIALETQPVPLRGQHPRRDRDMASPVVSWTQSGQGSGTDRCLHDQRGLGREMGLTGAHAGNRARWGEEGGMLQAGDR